MFTWNVSAIDCYPQVDGKTNVAFNVHWQLSATQDTYSGSVYSTCGVPAPTGAFTPYADLTQDQVLGWIWANGFDKDATEAVVQPALPWVV